jgi:riboflavin synthase
MFTGIIEDIARVQKISHQGTNTVFELEVSFGNELKIDQSLAHNGVCLTVVDINDKIYKVVAIEETLKRTNLGSWKVGEMVNVERCMLANGRFDGHIVQGHVDCKGHCNSIENKNGSWEIAISYANNKHITVEKGSICMNGISLTVVESLPNGFSVAIIPYTFEHTNLKALKVGSDVNLEFDIIGKYLTKML